MKAGLVVAGVLVALLGSWAVVRWAVAPAASTTGTEPAVPTRTEHPADPGSPSSQPDPASPPTTEAAPLVVATRPPVLATDDATATPIPTSVTPSMTAQAVYIFPVQPAADAGYGREHHDYPATDIFAPCGSSAVAPIDGTVDEVSPTDRWDPAVDDPATRGGLSVSLVGIDGVRYYGSHLASIADPVQPGAPILAGSPLGTVGQTGNAATTPCHLHFGISPPGPPGDWRTRRGVVWPWPYLDAWRQGESLSPQAEVAAL